MTATTSPLHHDAERIARYFCPMLTTAGLKDPDSGRVLEHAYATAFYAWLCAELSGHDAAWHAPACTALTAELDIIDKWHERGRKLGETPYFHWEFKMLALLHTEKLLRGTLPSELSHRLDHRLRHWHDLDIDSANWTAMRMVNYALRRHPGDALRSALEWQRLLRMQTPDGFFPDTPTSNSFQYHAYVLALLALAVRGGVGQGVQGALLRGVRFIAPFINPDGDFNYYGRGQRQLFGYAALVFALGEAAHLTTNPEERDQWQAAAGRVYRYITTYRLPEGMFPIVLNHAPPGERLGWYDYNNTGDYLAFCGVMLALTDSAITPTVTDAPSRPYALISHHPEIAVIASPAAFAVFAAGSSDASEPCGLVHLWPGEPSCLGGPNHTKNVQYDYAGNYLGPVINGRAYLYHRRATFRYTADTLTLRAAGDGLSVTQTITLSDAVTLRFEAKTLTEDVPPFDVIFSAPGESFGHPADTTTTAPSPAGRVTVHHGPVCTGLRHWSHRVTLWAADETPPSQSHFQWMPLPQTSTPSRCHNTITGRVLKGIWVLWVSYIRRIRRAG